MQKHGVKNFTFEVIGCCNSQDAANNSEIYLIKQYESHVSTGKGYNVSWGGKQSPLSEETKQKMRDNWKDPEFKAKMCAAIKLAKSNLTKEQKETFAQNLSNALKGRHLSEATEFKVGHTFNVNTLQKMSESHKGIAPWNKSTKGVCIPWNKGTKGICKSWNKGTIGLAKNGSKLTKEDLLNIIHLYNNKEKSKHELSKMFHIGERAIRNIIYGRTWARTTGIKKEIKPKLTEHQVLEIVSLYKTNNFTQQQLAEKFNVSKSTIKSIVYGQRWNYLTHIR